MFQLLFRVKRVQLRLEGAWGALCGVINAPLQRAGGCCVGGVGGRQGGKGEEGEVRCSITQFN